MAAPLYPQTIQLFNQMLRRSRRMEQDNGLPLQTGCRLLAQGDRSRPIDRNDMQDPLPGIKPAMLLARQP